MNKIKLLFLIMLCTKHLLAQEISTVKGIRFVGLSVKDLDKSVAFYSNTMQLKELSRNEINKKTRADNQRGFTNLARKTALLQGPNCQLELMEFEENKGKNVPVMPIEGPGITHVCFQSPMAKSIYEKVKTFGANILSRGNVPIDRGYGITYAYARDANGIMFEMEHFAEPPFGQDVQFGHVALVTPDIDRLVGFYTQLLGIEPYRRVDDIKNSPKLDDIANIDSLKMRAAWFKLDNMILEMWQFQNPKTKLPTEPLPFSQIGYNVVAFRVGNLQNEFKRMSPKGVKFLSVPIQNSNTSTVYVRDPDGNLLLLEEIQQ